MPGERWSLTHKFFAPRISVNYGAAIINIYPSEPNPDATSNRDSSGRGRPLEVCGARD
jgi:hypothetical protein